MAGSKRKSAADKDSAMDTMPPPPRPPRDSDSDSDGEEGAVHNLDEQDLDLVRNDDGSFALGTLRIPPPPAPALTFDNDRPRLIITHIDNENFKSYAGLQTLGPFHKSFTSIVGPNGSGKSNVIDSMLFVFGYKAQKIRSKKIAVLIHNSEDHKDLTFATVTVHFQEIVDRGEDEFDVIEGSKFSVSRTVRKDNSSFYKIDERRATFKEVRDMLMAKGIDLDHNRFLILQGEVEMIALMKPKGLTPNDKGMLEFLEDIIGSNRFQAPIDLLKESVGKLDDVRMEKLNRVKLVEKEKDELEGPRNEALDYIRLENQIALEKNLQYQQYVHDHERKLEVTEEKKRKYEESASETLEKAKKVEDERVAGEERKNAADAHLDKVRNKMEKVQDRFKDHELKDSTMKEEMRTLNTKRKKLMHLAKTEQEKLDRQLRVPETNKEKIEECQVLKEKLEATKEDEQAKYDEAVATLNEETKQYQDEREVHENKLTGIKSTLNERQGVLRETQMEMDLLRSNEEKERCKLESFTGQKDSAARELEAKKERYTELKKNLPAIKKELEKRERALDAVTEREAQLNDKLQHAQVDYQEKNSRLTQSRSKGHMLDAILAEKTAGRLPGVFGRLGDLGAIDAKYDIAISTAGGGKLDQILVDTIDTGKACIEFLRRNNLGRANFLALDKQAQSFGNKRQGHFDCPRDSERLYDLIRVSDEQFLPAFYSAVRDTLVAADIDLAHKIAFQGKTRHRVVTFAGALIETSGSMSGGGRPAKGKMGTQVEEAADDCNLDKLREGLNHLKDEHHRAATEKNELERSIAHARKEIGANEKELEKLGLDISHLEEKVKGLEAQIKNQTAVLKKTKPDEVKLAALSEKEEEQQAAVDEIQEQVDEVDSQVARLNKKIKEIKSGKLKGISKKLDEVTNQLGNIKNEIAKLEVGIKSAERDLKKIKDRLEGFESEVKEAEDKMRQLKTQREELDEHGKEVIERLKGLRADEEETAANCEKLAEEVKKLKEAEDKLKSEQIEINQVREQFDAEIKNLAKTAAHWKRELKRLKLKEVPGDETELELPKHSVEELEALDMKAHMYKLNLSEEKLASQSANFAAIEEFNKKEAVYLDRVNELTAITTRKDRQKKFFEELRKQRLNEFLKGFSIITTKLKEMYQMITLGGDAELELVDTLDPFSEGITFSVRPPKKSWKNISNLSGGEKTLSSLALVFALHYYKPTPLYVMDEIDAALDFKNVSIVANYIKERTKNAQFVIISLRSNMFELADRLVGIYKTYNATKSVTINPGLIAAAGKVEQ